MIIVNNPSHDPYFNLALEEYLLKNLHVDETIAMLWQNSPAIIVGKHQNTLEQINTAYVQEHNIAVVRRLSGGGAVYHDLGNLNFTFIVPRQKQAIPKSFAWFSQPVITVLAELGVKAEFSGRNDIQIDGKKFCGNAQYLYADKQLHHGAILFDTDLTVLQKALQIKPSKFQGKGVDSVRSRVTNIVDYLSEPLPIEKFKELLLKAMVEMAQEPVQRYELTAEDLGQVNKLREEKYITWQWNYGESPDFNVKKEQKFPGGTVEIYLNVQQGMIKNCKIYGDFFANEDVTILENRLSGLPYNAAALRRGLEGVEISQYILNVGTEEFLQCLTG